MTRRSKLGLTDWSAIVKTTYDNIQGHHRHKQFHDLMGHWSNDATTKVDDLQGTITLLMKNHQGRALVFSNHRGLCPRYRLMDYSHGIALECGIRIHENVPYINTIFAVTTTGLERPQTELIFNFDLTLDVIVQFNAQRMSDLNQLLEV